MKKIVVHFRLRDRGASIISYGILSAVIAIGALLAVARTGDEITESFALTANEISQFTSENFLELAALSAADTAAEIGAPFELDLADFTTISQSLDAGDIDWTVASGILPTGLSLDASVISGTPEIGETREIVVAASAGTLSDTKALTFIAMPPPGEISLAVMDPDAVPGATVGQPYSLDLQEIATTSGAYTESELSWSVASGTLPGEFSLDPDTGVIAGTPADTFSREISVRAESRGKAATGDITLTAEPPEGEITLASAIPGAAAGEPYTLDLKKLTSTTGAYTTSGLTWSLASGALPAGMNLDSASGVISGTPAAAETPTATIAAHDLGKEETSDLTLDVQAAADAPLARISFFVSGDSKREGYFEGTKGSLVTTAGTYKDWLYMLYNKDAGEVIAGIFGDFRPTMETASGKCVDAAGGSVSQGAVYRARTYSPDDETYTKGAFESTATSPFEEGKIYTCMIEIM